MLCVRYSLPENTDFCKLETLYRVAGVITVNEDRLWITSMQSSI